MTQTMWEPCLSKTIKGYELSMPLALYENNVYVKTLTYGFSMPLALLSGQECTLDLYTRFKVTQSMWEPCLCETTEGYGYCDKPG